MKKILLLPVFCFIVTALSAQTTTKSQKPAPKAAVISIKGCHLPADTSIALKLSQTDVQTWGDEAVLKVICNGSETFTLTQFNFTIIFKEPFQSKEYGIANGGIPILGKKAIQGLKSGDTILLREVNAKDVSEKDVKLPNIVFSIL